MRIGELRQRVTIQQLISGQDEYGQPVNAWDSIATVWAKVEDLAGREYFQAQQVPTSQVNTRITIRWRLDVKPEMRIVSGDRIFDIVAVLNPTGKKIELQLMCREVVP
jgi:SPP1 family predicted phage head-tail adaptor